MPSGSGPVGEAAAPSRARLASEAVAARSAAEHAERPVSAMERWRLKGASSSAPQCCASASPDARRAWLCASSWLSRSHHVSDAQDAAARAASARQWRGRPVGCCMPCASASSSSSGNSATLARANGALAVSAARRKRPTARARTVMLPSASGSAESASMSTPTLGALWLGSSM